MEFRSNNNDSSQNNCELLRYRSAPISLVANFTNLTSGLSSDDTNTVNVMKKGDNGCNKAFFAMNSQLPPPYPRQDCGQGYFRAVTSIRMDYECQRKITNPQNGYRGSKLFASEGGATGDLITSSNRLRNQTNFSSLGILSRISEVEHESGMPNGPNQAKVENKNGEKSPSRFGSWSNDYLYDAENFTGGIKREMNDDGPVFVGSQSRQPGNRSHHLSLPKTAAEIGAVEKVLHFQGIVPCKVRAKRGCATHPRSIAERVRRTRISERMRKLQDLVPNMDKQTNTADMLDFAVEYIKRLQKQYRALSEIRANCKCEGVSKSSTLN